MCRDGQLERRKQLGHSESRNVIATVTLAVTCNRPAMIGRLAPCSPGGGAFVLFGKLVKNYEYLGAYAPCRVVPPALSFTERPHLQFSFTVPVCTCNKSSRSSQVCIF